MCIAFPKAGEGDPGHEPRWRSLLLLVPRLVALGWMLVRMLLEAAWQGLKERAET